MVPQMNMGFYKKENKMKLNLMMKSITQKNMNKLFKKTEYFAVKNF